MTDTAPRLAGGAVKKEVARQWVSGKINSRSTLGVNSTRHDGGIST